MKKVIFYIMLISFLIGAYATTVAAIEVAPRISDREIVERLSRLEEGQKSLETRIDDLRSDINHSFDLLTWVFGLFITIALVILGFLVKMQWQMQKRQTQIETSLETQKDEMVFLKKLIDKLLPPKGAL